MSYISSTLYILFVKILIPMPKTHPFLLFNFFSMIFPFNLCASIPLPLITWKLFDDERGWGRGRGRNGMMRKSIKWAVREETNRNKNTHSPQKNEGGKN